MIVEIRWMDIGTCQVAIAMETGLSYPPLKYGALTEVIIQGPLHNNTVHWTYDRLYLAETAETHQVHCQVSSYCL